MNYLGTHLPTKCSPDNKLNKADQILSFLHRNQIKLPAHPGKALKGPESYIPKVVVYNGQLEQQNIWGILDAFHRRFFPVNSQGTHVTYDLGFTKRLCSVRSGGRGWLSLRYSLRSVDEWYWGQVSNLCACLHVRST